MPNSLVARLIS